MCIDLICRLRREARRAASRPEGRRRWAGGWARAGAAPPGVLRAAKARNGDEGENKVSKLIDVLSLLLRNMVTFLRHL